MWRWAVVRRNSSDVAFPSTSLQTLVQDVVTSQHGSFLKRYTFYLMFVQWAQAEEPCHPSVLFDNT